ncbi:MAG: hypothetical protein K5660_09495 [Paludibacteraceae bacterium]|nr:hypothetical protein [Paludibacteraceae bacterium]
MNQRFQSEEIRFVVEQYGNNELYRAICTIGPRLESELTGFGLCPEECFMEALELLSAIADKGDGILPELENVWLRKYNEYNRFDRHVREDVIRKAVGIVFGFTILAIDSSRHPFYRYKLTQQLTMVIANHQFEGWSSTLETIFSVPLADGWFDIFINEEPESPQGMDSLTKNANELQQQMNGKPFIVQFVQNQHNTGCQQFMGNMQNPVFTSTPQKDEAV